MFLLAQLVHPNWTNPPVVADLQVPPAVKQILRTSCYPCHSNETRLSWFDQIVPAYQLVALDVKEARTHLNFSEFGAQPVARRNAILFEALNHIQMGAMPLPRYTRLHPEAIVTSDQLTVLRDYLLSVTPETLPAQSEVDVADSKYREWIDNAGKPLPVRAAPNGIAFLPNYKNWKAISSTERSDNQTLRLILGNETAIKAISDGYINPWPDGTALAKVAWRQKAGRNGLIETGEIVHVAFMIKDRTKYASTAGWGWAQWDGAGLSPHGKVAGFAHECVSCHAPLSKNDYVFTMPIQSLRAHQ
ncbi:MAG: cytochrome P460 family protein [Bryobacteraceae bacterium]